MRRTTADAARTRADLIVAGARYFTTHPYANARLEEVATGVGVTRGAIYHHFGGKEGFFAAVVAQVFLDLRDRIVQVADVERDPWDGMAMGCSAFLQAAIDPTFQRIALLDGPAVLGWEAWRAIDARTTAGSLAEGLNALRDAGQLATEDVEALTIGLSGAMNELSLWIATRSDSATALRRATTIVSTMLAAYRTAS